MADINVRHELFGQPESCNKEALAERYVKHRSVSNPISNTGVLSSTAIFEVTTGNNEWMDLFKCCLTSEVTTGTVVSFGILENLGACHWQRGQLYINGRLVSSSNNYTNDSILSKRLQFSKSYNESVNDIRYRFGVQGVPASLPVATTPGIAVSDQKFSTREYLDGLFLRTSQGLWVPPNSRIRLELYPAADNGLNKSGFGTTTFVCPITVNDIYLTTSSIIDSKLNPTEHFMKFITMDSFRSTPDGTAHNQQVSVRDNLVRLSANFIDSTAEDDIKTHFTAAKFIYDTDGVSSIVTDKVNTLQFKAGQMVLPSEPFDTTYGFYQIYMDQLNMNQKVLDSAGGEPYDSWAWSGPFYSVPVVKQQGDQIKNVELRIVFKAAPTVSCFLTSFHEQIIRFVYNNSIPVDMEVAI